MLVVRESFWANLALFPPCPQSFEWPVFSASLTMHTGSFSILYELVFLANPLCKDDKESFLPKVWLKWGIKKKPKVKTCTKTLAKELSTIIAHTKLLRIIKCLALSCTTLEKLSDFSSKNVPKIIKMWQLKKKHTCCGKNKTWWFQQKVTLAEKTTTNTCHHEPAQAPCRGSNNEGGWISLWKMSRISERNFSHRLG